MLLPAATHHLATRPPGAASIDGVVLAGGRGRRMGGIEKALQPWQGRPLLAHVIERLRPQVRWLAINANRQLAQYERLGPPVWPDAPPGGRGPLDGIAAALARVQGDWLVCVPCDTPRLPGDLVPRLAAAATAAAAPAALAVTLEADGTRRPHPVICLLHRSLADDLRQCLDDGERRVGAWIARHRPAEAVFSDAAAFSNVNTLDDLDRLTAEASDLQDCRHGV